MGFYFAGEHCLYQPADARRVNAPNGSHKSVILSEAKNLPQYEATRERRGVHCAPAETCKNFTEQHRGCSFPVIQIYCVKYVPVLRMQFKNPLFFPRFDGDEFEQIPDFAVQNGAKPCQNIHIYPRNGIVAVMLQLCSLQFGAVAKFAFADTRFCNQFFKMYLYVTVRFIHGAPADVSKYFIMSMKFSSYFLNIPFCYRIYVSRCSAAQILHLFLRIFGRIIFMRQKDFRHQPCT